MLDGKVKKKGLGASLFVVVIIVIFAVFFSTANLVPAAISERLVEATDAQYADAVESKLLVLSQALRDGDLPVNTVNRLKQNGVLVGRVENGEFIEDAAGNVIKISDQIISADEFVVAAHENVNLYNAINNATYSRAAYYYDEAGERVLRELGSTRNNYTANSDFDEVMSSLVGEGSNININNVKLNESRESEDAPEYTLSGETAGSSEAAATLVEKVRQQNTADLASVAAMNAADSLNAADMTAREQKSSTYFLALMENISKMKAGEGDESKINEAMNYLFEVQETEVVDVDTGEIVTVRGSAMDAPSLYAVLSGEETDTAAVKNYAVDRVLKTVENQADTQASAATFAGTVASTGGKLRGTIGRYNTLTGVNGDAAAFNNVDKTLNKSLVQNGFSNIRGVDAGEMLVEGAVNVGRRLAMASGATAGDAAAVQEYARATETVLALDAAAEKLNTSPLDAGQPDSVLGALMRNMAVMSGSNLFGATNVAVGASTGTTDAAKYLSYTGDCTGTTVGSIGAAGTSTCAAVATFDTSTLADTFNDTEFINFVEANTEMNGDTRKIKTDSKLAEFIKYNDERKTPIGLTDGGILAALKNGNINIPVMSDIINMIKNFLGASEGEKRMATGVAFVNSSDNADWQTYKYAQRYVSLARAADALRAYDGDETAYTNLKYFEGNESPVIAFLDEYYNIASK